MRDTVCSPDSGRAIDLIALNDALARLEKAAPRKAQIVMLRFFAGLSLEETAAALELSEATVKREWNFARAWLLEAMSEKHDVSRRVQERAGSG